MGFSVDEAYLDELIEEFKRIRNDPEVENHDLVDQLVSSFENEDEYWDYLKERNRVTETIAAYKASIAEKYAEKNGIDEDAIQSSAEIQNHEQKVVDRIVEKADVEMVE